MRQNSVYSWWLFEMVQKLMSYMFIQSRHCLEDSPFIWGTVTGSLWNIHKVPEICLNTEMPFYPLWIAHHKDKIVSWPLYLYNGSPYTWKDSLYIETEPCFHKKYFFALASLSVGHWGLNKIDILPMAISNTFSWKRGYIHGVKWHYVMFVA